MSQPPQLRSVVLAALLLGLSLPCMSRAAAAPRIGDQVRNFEFTDFSGKQHHLSDFAGRYVLLDFWGTWCGPCVKEIPTLKRARALYQSRGLQILGLNSNQKLGVAQTFVLEKQIDWPQAVPDSTKRVINTELSIKWYPAMVLLDPQRKIVLVSGDGERFLSGGRLLKALDRILPSASPAR